MTRPTIKGLQASLAAAHKHAADMAKVRDTAKAAAKQVSEENDHLRGVIAQDKETIARMRGYIEAKAEAEPPRMVEAEPTRPAIFQSYSSDFSPNYGRSDQPAPWYVKRGA